MIPKRLERIESFLRKEIANILLLKIQDPRIKGVHLVNVRVSPDLSTAKVLYSTLEDNSDLEAIQKGLDSAKAYIRMEVGKRIRLKKIPQVFFVFDPSIKEGDRILTLLTKLEIPEEPPSSPQD